MKQQNIIGIIGGMGPQASAEFYRVLIGKARHEFGAHTNDAYPEILLDSVPVPDFLSSTENMEKAAIMLEDRVERLALYGASHITMACNTACVLADRLQKRTTVPFISVIDEVVSRVMAKEKKVLVLASPTSLRLGLYQLALVRYGVVSIVPKQKDFAELEYIIRAVIEGESRGPLMQKLVRIAERYIDDSIGGIVLGCTELPLVFPASYRIRVYSSLDILAEAVLKRYYYKKEQL